MSPFQLLEVAPGADEREIKRAYAHLLKRTRPDEDAAAFQRLQEAYARCLDIARARIAANVADDDVATRAPAPAPDDADARWRAPPRTGSASLQAPVAAGEALDEAMADDAGASDPGHGEERCFDVGAFVAALHELLDQPDARRMRDWLYAQEPLYLLQLKHALRPVVVQAIEQAPRIQERQVVATLLAFFGLDQMDREGLAERVQAVLEFRHKSGRLDHVVKNVHSRDQSWLNRRIAVELAGPEHFFRRLFLLLVPMVPTRIRNLLAQLRAIDPALRHPKLDPGQIAFWTQASDPIALSRPRLAMIALRVVVWFAMAFAWGALFLDGTYLGVARTAGYWMAGAAALWAVYALVKWVWYHGAHWAIQRLQLLPEEYDAIFSALLGMSLSWILGQNPLPVLIGGIRAYACMIRPLPGLPGIASILLALGQAVGWAMLTVPLESRVDVDTRVTLVLTLSLLPLLVVPAVRRWRLHPPRWSAWLLTQAVAAAAVFGALQLV